MQSINTFQWYLKNDNWIHDNGIEILGWKIIDENNKVTRVKVTESIQLNEEDIRSKPFFSFQEINRNNYKFFLGPYIRELKTIPKPGRL